MSADENALDCIKSKALDPGIRRDLIKAILSWSSVMDELTIADSHKSKNWRAEKSESAPENRLMLICVGITRIGLAYTGVLPAGTLLYIFCDPTKLA